MKLIIPSYLAQEVASRVDRWRAQVDYEPQGRALCYQGAVDIGRTRKYEDWTMQEEEGAWDDDSGKSFSIVLRRAARPWPSNTIPDIFQPVAMSLLLPKWPPLFPKWFHKHLL